MLRDRNQNLPAIDHNACAAHVVACWTCQENDRAGQIDGQTPSFCRHATHYIIVEVLILRIGAILGRHWSLEIARMDTIALNAVLGPLIRHGFGDLEHATFRCRVGRNVLAALPKC